MKNEIAFTLAEVLITLVIIGVIAAITVPVMVTNAHEQETVTKVKKMYSIISQVVRQYQFENNCNDRLADCLETETLDNNGFYKVLEKYLNYDKVVYPGESLSKIADYLPNKAKSLSGDSNIASWYAVWNSNTATKADKHTGNAYYLLADGSVLNVQVPDNHKKCGYVFFDTNGKKGPNQVGKDQFPIGIGADRNEKFAQTVHPYYNEDNGSSGGLCNITNNHECSADICTKDNCSPTAYIIKHSKLPQF